jgi:hypothetical protein
MHAPDQWGLYLKATAAKDPKAAEEDCLALIVRYKANLARDCSSRSDTLRQLSWQAQIASSNGLRDAERALGQIRDGSFHPSHILLFDLDANGKSIPNTERELTWEAWLAHVA